jgi:RNA polymerase sigma-70 factor (ECF subfamily)
MVSEEELIRRCVNQGDARAFELLVERHQSALRYSLRQMTGWDQDLADDLAQNTFIKAFKGLTSFRANAKFSTWLYRIAYNEFVSHCRKHKLETSGGGEDLDRFSAPAERNQDLHRDLAIAMLSLSPEQRSALHLTLHRQCTQQEIAEIMDCPLGTVKSHILRGREKLQIALADWREEIVA